MILVSYGKKKEFMFKCFLMMALLRYKLQSMLLQDSFSEFCKKVVKVNLLIFVEHGSSTLLIMYYLNHVEDAGAWKLASFLIYL